MLLRHALGHERHGALNFAPGGVLFACGARPPPAPPGLLLPGAALGQPVFASVRSRGDGVTQRWYLARSGSSSRRWEPLYWPRAERQSGVNNYSYLCTCAPLRPRRGRGGRGEVAGRPRAGSSRAGAPRANIVGVGLPLRLPRDRLALCVGRRPPPDCSRPGGGPPLASTSAAPRASERRRERAPAFCYSGAVDTTQAVIGRVLSRIQQDSVKAAPKRLLVSYMPLANSTSSSLA